MVTFASRPSPERNPVLPPLLVAKSKTDLGLLPAMANRHGLIAGATGTGKTVSLQTLAERFSDIGVPVFMADVKGDLAGLASPGGGNAKVAERVKSLGLEGLPASRVSGRVLGRVRRCGSPRAHHHFGDGARCSSGASST